MVFTNRQRRGAPLRAVRRTATPALRRLLAVGGLAAAGWLLGGAGSALADELPFESPAAVSQVRDAAEDGIGAAQERDGATDSADSADNAAGDARASLRALPGSALPDSDGSDATLRRTAAGAVRETAGETGDVVSGTARTGREIGSYVDRSLGTEDATLTESVSQRISRPTGELRDGLKEAIRDDSGSGPLTGLTETGLDALGGADPGDGTRTGGPGPVGSDDSDDAAPRRDDAPPESSESEDSGEEPAEAGTASRSPADAYGALSTERADEPADDSGSGDAPWRGGSDSAGTVSPSSSPVPGPAAAGFLAHRADSLHLLVKRVALPGDPTLVVRDAADDPSFSPD
ncbi:hypothetical protein HDA32_005112 [Spinactinospora alkalitolerans]|uniref:Uncharacterized protein n=1 Tax=Spinactinospora alkalitolerans TaxID=687207 RepID=A0A852U3E9_9ACTN|nr:hypothetical protein [Spinactinospora alkalitolerans]NYE49992.1 hypothetical protein [Spinactinospora alkalitolerans]